MPSLTRISSLTDDKLFFQWFENCDDDHDDDNDGLIIKRYCRVSVDDPLQCNFANKNVGVQGISGCRKDNLKKLILGNLETLPTEVLSLKPVSEYTTKLISG